MKTVLDTKNSTLEILVGFFVLHVATIIKTLVPSLRRRKEIFMVELLDFFFNPLNLYIILIILN